MRLGAELASVRAEGRAQALAPRHRTLVRGFHVRGRGQPVRVDGVQNVHVRTVVELNLPRSLLVLLCEVPAVELVLPLQLLVLDLPDPDDPRGAIVEGGALQEGAFDLVGLGTNCQGLQGEVRVGSWQGVVAAPARVDEAEVPPPAVAGDAPGAALVGGAVRVVHRERPPDAALEEGRAVEAVHLLATEGLHQGYLCLRELAAHDADLRQLCRGAMLREEGPDVRRQLLVGKVPMEEAEPEGVGGLRTHHAGAVRRQRLDGAPSGCSGEHDGADGGHPCDLRALGSADHGRRQELLAHGGLAHHLEQPHLARALGNEQRAGAGAVGLCGELAELASAALQEHDLALDLLPVQGLHALPVLRVKHDAPTEGC
mmetsp:Transcript_100422/g.266957  ORF Transcript_100422/g.266957 Transcript_100422/m.266957 type:complete len:371 (+) Transcript_100422:669-1781(+)